MSIKITGVRLLSLLGVALFLAAGVMFLSRGGKAQTWTGEISDAMCAGDHTSMGGNNAADCTRECVQTMRSKYGLVVDDGTYFDLSDQRTPEDFAGERVKVTGLLSSANQINVKTIESVD